MSIIKVVIKFFAITLAVIVILGLLLFPIYLGLEYGQLPSIPEYWLQYLSIFLSCFSFIAVLVTIWIQSSDSKKQQEQIVKNFDFAQQNYDSQVLDKIHYFMSDNMSKCRSSCWILWAQLRKSKGTNIRVELLSLFKQSIVNDYGDEIKAQNTFNSTIFYNYSYFIKMARYLDVISNYRFTELTAKALHYYYIFYRPLFIEMSRLYNEAYNATKPNKRITQVKDGWVNLVPKLDAVMAANKLPIE